MYSIVSYALDWRRRLLLQQLHLCRALPAASPTSSFRSAERSPSVPQWRQLDLSHLELSLWQLCNWLSATTVHVLLRSRPLLEQIIDSVEVRRKYGILYYPYHKHNYKLKTSTITIPSAAQQNANQNQNLQDTKITDLLYISCMKQF